MSEETKASSTRNTCPKCGGHRFRTEDDRSKILHYGAGGFPVYAKKFTCGGCAHRWS